MHGKCPKCGQNVELNLMAERMNGLYDRGLTWEWQATGETRQKKRWFGRGSGMKTQMKEMKIEMPPEMFPIAVCRWRTVK